MFCLLVVLGLSGCAAPETEEEAQMTYVRNVESCVCRYMVIEEEHYSGITYSDMVSRCNRTVHDANPARYTDELAFEPEIEQLRCVEDVEPWLEVVEDAKKRQRVRQASQE